MKAGGAYVPIDTTYPEERVRTILEDAGANIILLDEELTGKISQRFNIVCLDSDWKLIGQEDNKNLECEPHADNLAYAIFTSGSTGRPKGVAVTHSSLMNLVMWHQQIYQVTPDDRASQVAAIGFDASVWELWPYLAAGASIHIADEETRTDPNSLLNWLMKERITLSFAPTPLAESLLELVWPEEHSLRAMLTGGDKLRKFPKESFGSALINHYGPTESTVVATVSQVKERGFAAKEPTIGRAIANTAIYLLDNLLSPVAMGISAELCIGGGGLARGYLNRPDLTADKFIPDPFGPSGSRLYRTGDLASYSSDGNIIFLGRIDHQVKVRGFRIELGEIESVLSEHPLVEQALVVARDIGQGGSSLVAYVQGSILSQGWQEVLRAHLRQRLPDYMLPSFWVRLEQFPLTPNGKIDRKALPEPHKEQSQSATAGVEFTPTEELLAGNILRRAQARAGRHSG